MKKVKYINRRGLSPAEYQIVLGRLQEMTAAWVATLSQAMAKTGEGYKRAPQGRTGRGQDRRQDKLLGSTKLQRSIAVRGIVAGHTSTRPWVTRASRLNRLAMRGL